MITVYDSLNGPEADVCDSSQGSPLEADWRRLYAISPDATPYQSIDYVRAALALCDGAPHIIAWQSKGGKITGAQAIFPCWIDRKGTLRFVADAHTDFCGPLVDPSCAGGYHLCEELAEHILATPQIRRVRLENIRSRLFQSGLQYHLKGCVLFGYRKYSVMKVPAIGGAKSAIDALAHLSTKEKYRLKNIASKMDAAGVDFRLFDSNEAWPAELIGTLTQSMVAAGIRKPEYFSPGFLDFLKGVYDAGLMVVCATFRDGTPLACNLLLRGGASGELIDWIALYDDPVSNGWNLLQCIRWVSAQGGGTLNFARGVYMYKMHNYRPALYDLDRLRWSRSRLGRLADLLGCLVEQSKRSRRSR